MSVEQSVCQKVTFYSKKEGVKRNANIFVYLPELNIYVSIFARSKLIKGVWTYHIAWSMQRLEKQKKKFSVVEINTKLQLSLDIEYE